MRGLLVVLVGPPGAGKSTWARANAEGAVTVSQDDLIEAITPQGFAHEYRPVYAAAEDAVARAGLLAGRVVIVDRTNRTRRLRARWLELGRECRCGVVAVELGTAAEVCRARNAAREGPRRVSEERMERMLAAYERVGGEEGFLFVAGGTARLAELVDRAKEERR